MGVWNWLGVARRGPRAGVTGAGADGPTAPFGRPDGREGREEEGGREGWGRCGSILEGAVSLE